MQMPVMAKDVFIGDPYRAFGLLPSSRIDPGKNDPPGRPGASVRFY
jgi:hypothetical protein